MTEPDDNHQATGIGPTASELMPVLDAVPAVITFCDPELRVRFANSYGVAWLGGSSRSDVLGKRFEELLPPEVYEANLPHALAALDGAPEHFQRSFIDSAGLLKHVQASYTPAGEPSAIAGFFVHVTDITDRIQSEAVLREQTRRLAQLNER